MLKEHVGDDEELTTSETEAVVRFYTSKSEDELAVILKRLIQDDIPVSQFRELQTDLEDTFLSITREKEPTDPADAAVQ